MAFVDNQMAIIGDNVRNVPVADKALDERHIDDARRLSFPAADDADLLRVNAQKGTETRDPLIEQFRRWTSIRAPCALSAAATTVLLKALTAAVMRYREQRERRAPSLAARSSPWDETLAGKAPPPSR